MLLPFPADSDAFGRPEQAWMRFASTADPEGNPIQLWEPSPDALQEPPDRHH